MLGQHCNLSCKYCMQHDLITTLQDKQTVNKDIFTFIRNHAKKQQNAIDVRFYGGEPLLYFNDIKCIVNELKEDNISFSIISNGRLLNQEIVDFINNNNFTSFALSWDGRNTRTTRGYDVLIEKRDLILKLDKLCLSGVISAYNYYADYMKDTLQLQEEYIEMHGIPFSTTMDEIVDACGKFTDLNNFDYNKINIQAQHITHKMIEAALHGKSSVLINRIYLDLFIFYCYISDTENICNKSFCRNGINVINMDLNGNLYQCHNNWIKIGSIYSSYNNYMSKAKILDERTKENYETECKDCSVLPLCKSGCPLISRELREKTGYCKLRKIAFKPIIELIEDSIKYKGDFNLLLKKYSDKLKGEGELIHTEVT